MNCVICEIRKPKRHCPGVRGEICSTCCGTEREQTVDCPLDCEFLREAHRHEKPLPFDAASIPHAEIKLSDAFLHENEPLLMLLSAALLEISVRTKGANDFDVREALETLVMTYKALESGLYYESRPQNPLAAAIHAGVQERVTEIRKRETEASGTTKLRDAAILGMLIFLQRLELAHNNGRRKSKAFLESIAGFFAQAGPAADTSVEPTAPSLIL